MRKLKLWIKSLFNVWGLVCRLTEAEHDVLYYQTVNDLLQTENEELREALKSAKGQLALKSLDVTYPAQVA